MPGLSFHPPAPCWPCCVKELQVQISGFRVTQLEGIEGKFREFGL